MEKCLFGVVKLKEHADVDMYQYSGYAIGFDRKRLFSISAEIGRIVIIFLSRYKFISTYW